MGNEKYLNQEMEIKSPIDGIINILKTECFSDFKEDDFVGDRDVKISKDDVVNFCTFALIQLDQNDNDTSESISEYFNSLDNDSEEGRYNARRIGKTDFVIVFSEIKKGILLDVFLFLIDFFPSYYVNGKINYLLIGKNAIRILFRCIKKLETPEERCLFALMIEKNNDFFQKADFIPYSTEGDNKYCERNDIQCDRRNKQYRYCQMPEGAIDQTIENFVAKKILKPFGNGWKLNH